jgi:hypothetical protein
MILAGEAARTTFAFAQGVASMSAGIDEPQVGAAFDSLTRTCFHFAAPQYRSSGDLTIYIKT